MITLNEYLVDEYIYRGIVVSRIEAGFQDEVLDILRLMSKDISQLVMGVDLDTPNIPANLKRLKKIKGEIDEITKDYYSKIQTRLTIGYAALATSESIWLDKTIKSYLKIDLLKTSLNPDLLKALTKNVMIDGTPSVDWWAKQQASTMFRFMREMRLGIIQGDDIHSLISRVRGTRKLNYSDGVMATTRREAEALARTSVQAVLNDTRFQIYTRNKKLIKGIEWHSALDFRVCIMCRPRDGSLWDLEGKPLNGRAKKLKFRLPPIHYNDRCIMVPIIYSWSELAERYKGDTEFGKMLDKMPTSTRATIDGQVPDTKTFTDWLNDQDSKNPKKVEALMGQRRYQLWKSGRVSLYGFLNSRGEPIPINRLG